MLSRVKGEGRRVKKDSLKINFQKIGLSQYFRYSKHHGPPLRIFEIKKNGYNPLDFEPECTFIFNPSLSKMIYFNRKKESLLKQLASLQRLKLGFEEIFLKKGFS